MCSARLRQRVPSARPIGIAPLSGWDLRFHKRSQDGSGKCNLVRSKESGATVHGVVFEIDPSEKQQLDEVEGLGYRCEDLKVRIGAEVLTVYTYLAEARFLDDSLLPYGWYRDLVVAGAREHGLPEDYVEKLLAVQVRTDPNTKRDAENRRLLDL